MALESKTYIRCANSNKMLEYSQVKLIEEVEKRPGLWSVECQGGRDEKLHMWKEVGAAMFKDWRDCSKATAYDRVLQLQRKWRSLRDAYKREIRGRKSGKRVARTTYRYFKNMSFLGGHDGVGPSKADTVEDEDNNDNTLNDNDNTLNDNDNTLNDNDNNLNDNDNTLNDSKDDVTMEIEALDVGFDDSYADPLDQLTVVSTSKLKKAARKPRKKVQKHQSSSEDMNDREEMEIPLFTYDMNEREHDNETDSDKLFLISFLPEMKQLPLNLKMWVRAQIANTMQEAVSCHYNNTTPTFTIAGIKRQRQESSE